MSCNSFGQRFRITTFGESHGRAVGVVIDGVPPNLCLDLGAIQQQLDRRRPGQSPVSSPRAEPDRLEVLSGLHEGRTTGGPLCLLVENRDARPEAYESLRHVFRPGHGDLTWWRKYGTRDWRGGGRASGRETVARVAAGAVARQVLAPLGVSIVAYVVEADGVRAHEFVEAVIETNPMRCADSAAATEMLEAVEAARLDGDSVGAIVEVRARGVPAGWGDPVFGKLDALLAGGLMSIGAVKGVEVGGGFALARLRGSESNDPITPEGFASNQAGGILGGISSGAELVLRVAVKPTPSIRRPQSTVDQQGNAAILSVTGRHDPCIGPRLVPVAEAMVALVLVDAYLNQLAIDAHDAWGSADRTLESQPAARRGPGACPGAAASPGFVESSTPVACAEAGGCGSPETGSGQRGPRSP